MIKILARKFVLLLVNNSVTRKVVTATIVRFANFFEWEKGKLELDAENVVNTISPDLTVKHGPFKSMVFPHLNFTYCPIIPMILGSYERELHPIIEGICQEGLYSEVIDIGCAEGYYAVGLAMRMPDVKVLAFDIDENARELCHKLASKNGVSEQLTIKGECSPEILPTIDVRTRALVVVDCEGCEKTLFTKENVLQMTKHDYLIEVHDCVDITISQVLRDVFEETHEIKVIQTIDDIKKVQTYDYIELQGYDLEKRRKILSEYRNSAMEWFYITSKR